MVDLSECTVTVVHEDGDNSPGRGIRGENNGKITLHFNGGGEVDSLFEFRGEYLSWCLIYYDLNNQNPICYTEEPSDDHLEMALRFIERYEVFTDDPVVGEMRELLESNTDVQPGSKTEGNIKFTISDREVPDFSWSYTIENEDYFLLRIGFFDPPHIFSLGDSRYRLNLDSSVFPKYEPLFPAPNLESPTASESAQTAEASSANLVVDSVLGSLIMVAIVAVPVFAVVVFCKRKQGKVIPVDRLIAFVYSRRLFKEDSRGGEQDA
jgi:hypothetical protein